MKKILDLVNKASSANAGDLVHVNEAVTAEEALATLSQEARKALRDSGIWRQEFHGNEIVSLIAMYMATRSELLKKSAALGKAVDFLGEMEIDDHYKYGIMSVKCLEQINQIISGETISESVRK